MRFNLWVRTDNEEDFKKLDKPGDLINNILAESFRKARRDNTEPLEPRSAATPYVMTYAINKPPTSELTFEQQQEISAILEQYRTNPSNSNKFRYELFSYIEALLAKQRGR